ncbi:hypothetical protein [Desulfoluna sp.]|uniref:hypothetical protein n=1 Tax=Desulfoluna sp. TaxID=2045199 RepID=UPI002616A2EB|nr:hypothetical protein [Desulfoluna sp.]
MPIVETITVRAVGPQRENLLCLLESHIDAFRFPEHLTTVECQAHADMDSDISIHLTWDRPFEKRWKSDLCILLEDNLKEFGLIDSNAWIRRFYLSRTPVPPQTLKTDVHHD